MRPRIVVDGRMVGPIPHGFSRYLTNMARGLLELQESVTLPYELVFLVSKETPASAFGGFGTVETGAPFLSPLELLEIPVVLRRLNAALYHSPTFSSFPGFTLPCPWVATVHDLNHLRFGSASKRLYYRWLLKPFARKAAALLTVSDFSRRELSAWSGVAETAIEVVHNSLDEAYGRPLPDEAVRPVLERFGLEPGKYFFCLSNPKPH
ncbi:MAG: glycosyltransferase, partial [Oligoflexia bacterium]|nr:glycosyltransferase [Oligoflexia bacterium]